MSITDYSLRARSMSLPRRLQSSQPSGGFGKMVDLEGFGSRPSYHELRTTDHWPHTLQTTIYGPIHHTARTEVGQGQLAEILDQDAKYIRTIAHTLGAYHTSRFENNPCGIRFMSPDS